ncbi:MAG: rhodanese-like domain-containing protein [Terrimicrobiaceae bacterium]
MSRTVRELMLIALACAAALALGLLTNLIRREPLPLLYEDPAMRIVRAVSPAGQVEIREPETIDFKQAKVAAKDSRVLFVDARASAFFELGHIPGAINLPREEILQSKGLADLTEKARPLIVYCSGEDCEDSRIVAQGLSAMGYSNVSVYAGGWEEWSASGSPVQK